MWVPWRAGATSAEQARRRTGRAVRGQVSANQAAATAVAAHRKALFRQLRQHKITPEEYQKALRKLGN